MWDSAKGLQSTHHRDACTAPFIAALTTATLKNEPRCPSAEEELKRMKYRHTVESVCVCVSVWCALVHLCGFKSALPHR